MAERRERRRRGLLIVLAVVLLILLAYIYFTGGAPGVTPTPTPTPTPGPQPGLTEYKPTQNPPNSVDAVFVPDHAVCDGNTCTITKTVFGEYRDIFASSFPIQANITVGYVFVDYGSYRFWLFGLAQSQRQNYTDGAMEIRLYPTHGYVYFNLGGGQWAGLYLEYFNVSNVHVYLPGMGIYVPDRPLSIKIEVDRDNAIVYVNGQPVSYNMAQSKPTNAKVVWLVSAYTTTPGTYQIKFG